MATLIINEHLPSQTVKQLAAIRFEIEQIQAEMKQRQKMIDDEQYQIDIVKMSMTPEEFSANNSLQGAVYRIHLLKNVCQENAHAHITAKTDEFVALNGEAKWRD